MRRLAVSVVMAAALAAGCGSGREGDAIPAGTTGPTKAELVAREKLVAQIKAGTYKCYCHSALRARERVARGLVDEP